MHMLTIKRVLTFFSILISFSSFTQVGKIDEKSFDYSKFPTIKFNFWQRSINEIDKSQHTLFENSKGVKIKSIQETGLAKKESSKNKIILLLIENHYLNKGIGERAFFKSVIQKSISGRINNGDSYYLATFDWFRNGKYTSLLNYEPITSEEDLNFELNKIQALSNLNNKQTGSDIYNALSESMQFLAGLKDKSPKNIILFSDDYPNIVSQKTVKEVELESLKNDIPIYGIGYEIGDPRYQQITRDRICYPTNGKYFVSKRKLIDESSDQLGSFIDKMSEYSLGKSYVLEYESNSKKLGNEVEIKYENQLINPIISNVQYPFNLIDWIKENKLYTLLIILMICLVGYFSKKYYTILKNKKFESDLLQQERDLELQNLEEKQKRTEEKLVTQASEFEKKVKLDHLKKLMLKKGVYPKITYKINDVMHVCHIDDPFFKIGRSGNSNSLNIDNAKISRSHAEINFNEKGEFQLSDLNSTNGVYLNHEKIISLSGMRTALEPINYKLKDGDLITLGDITLKINF